MTTTRDLPVYLKTTDSQPGDAPVHREPTVGRWYCCMEKDHFSDFIRDGSLIRYEGDGVFTDDDGEETDIDQDCDYLQEQF